MSIHSYCARPIIPRNDSCIAKPGKELLTMAEVKSKEAVEAMEVAEASRETTWEKPSFVGDLFLGNLNLDLIHPFPEQPEADKKEADEFLANLERFMAENVDADKIDAEGEYDYSLFDGFNKLGAWGMKIPKEYGGEGVCPVDIKPRIALVSRRGGP